MVTQSVTFTRKDSETQRANSPRKGHAVRQSKSCRTLSRFVGGHNLLSRYLETRKQHTHLVPRFDRLLFACQLAVIETEVENVIIVNMRPILLVALQTESALSTTVRFGRFCPWIVEPSDCTTPLPAIESLTGRPVAEGSTPAVDITWKRTRKIG